MQLAVFDLDGTITRRDSLVPYITGFLNARPWRWIGLPGVLPALVRYAIVRGDPGPLKGALIRNTLGGSTRTEIDEWTRRYVPELVAHGLFQDAVAKVAEHRANADHLVLMSASTDLYVREVGAALGFTEVICTGVSWEGDRLRGDLNTPNRRGEEKARCFRELTQRYPNAETFAYGNAGTDLPHLRLAKHGFLVNGSPTAREKARALGVTAVTWA